MNALLMHHLDLYEECSPTTGIEGCLLLTNFLDLFQFWFYLIIWDSWHQQRLEEMDNRSITRLTTVVIDNCLKMTVLLETESKAIPSRKLLKCLEDSVLAATGLIMKLHKRNRPIQGIYGTEENQAKHLLKEMLNKIPEVVSKPIHFQKPLQHVIVERHLKAKLDPYKREEFMDNDICKLLAEVIDDFDAVDNEGNTMLLTVASLLKFNNARLKEEYRPVKPEPQILEFLIHQGAYVYAKNNEGKTVVDYLDKFVMETESSEEAQSILEALKSQVPRLQSLAALKAKDLISVNDIPRKIEKFLEMH